MLRSRLDAAFERIGTAAAPNEARTEQMLIFPVLDALGWDADRRMVQIRAARRGRADVPDCVLFSTPEATTRARGETSPERAFHHGAVIVENKRLGAGARPRARHRTPG
jgi:hypothetical protein